MKKYGLWILCLLFLFIPFGFAHAKSQTIAEIALENSEFADYQMVAQGQAGSYGVIFATQKDGTHSLFAIAEKLDGQPSLVRQYVDFLPTEWSVNDITVDIHNNGDKDMPLLAALYYQNPEKSYCQSVVFIKKEDTWFFYRLNVEFEEKQYSINHDESKFECICFDIQRGYFVTLNELPVDPQTFSIPTVMKIIHDAIYEKLAKEKEEIASVLQQSFPNETLDPSSLLAWHEHENNETSCLLAVMAEKDGTFTFYLAHHTPERDSAFSSSTLLPLTSTKEAEALSFYIPYEDENLEIISISAERYEPFYHFRLEQNTDGEWKLKKVSYQDESGIDFWATFDDNQIKIQQSIHMGNAYYALCPPDMKDIATFDIKQLFALVQETHAAILRGDPPIIPTAKETPCFPQPCVATLKQGKYDVYTGPGTNYYREAGGKAQVSTNDWVQVFGREGDYALIQYHVSGDLYRFGYIHKKAFLDFESVPLLTFENVPFEESNEFCTSNPLGVSPPRVELGYADHLFTRLAYFDDCWLYVSLDIDGKPARMFIEQSPTHG